MEKKVVDKQKNFCYTIYIRNEMVRFSDNRKPLFNLFLKRNKKGA